MTVGWILVLYFYTAPGTAKDVSASVTVSESRSACTELGERRRYYDRTLESYSCVPFRIKP